MPALTLIVVGAALLRLWLTVSHDGYLGIDGGAYLLSVQQVLGQNPIGQDFTRPPLGPGWGLVPFTAIFGYDIGYKVWSALASLAPIPAVYLLSRRLFSHIPAALVAAFYAFSPTSAELLVTGALPLLGFAVIILAMWGIIPNIDDIKHKPALILILSIPLIAALNMTSAGLALIVLPLFTVSVALLSPISNQTLKGWRLFALKMFTTTPAVAAMGLGAILSLALLPWYMDVMPGTGNLNHPGSRVIFAPFTNWGWYVLGFAGFFGIYALRFGSPVVRALSIVVLVLGGLSVVWSHDEAIMNVTFRGRYLAVTLMYVLGAWCIGDLWERLRVPRNAFTLVSLLVLIPGMIGVFAFGYYRAFHAQAYYSDQILPSTARALEYVGETDPESSIVVNTFSMAWWVQALHRVPAPAVWNQAPPPKWDSEYAHVRCILNWEPCDVGLSIKALNAGWVIADTSFPWRNDTVIDAAPDGNMWAYVDQAHWLELVYEEGSTRLWRVKPASFY